MDWRWPFISSQWAIRDGSEWYCRAHTSVSLVHLEFTNIVALRAKRCSSAYSIVAKIVLSILLRRPAKSIRFVMTINICPRRRISRTSSMNCKRTKGHVCAMWQVTRTVASTRRSAKCSYPRRSSVRVRSLSHLSLSTRIYFSINSNTRLIWPLPVWHCFFSCSPSSRSWRPWLYLAPPCPMIYSSIATVSVPVGSNEVYLRRRCAFGRWQSSLIVFSRASKSNAQFWATHPTDSSGRLRHSIGLVGWSRNHRLDSIQLCIGHTDPLSIFDLQKSHRIDSDPTALAFFVIFLSFLNALTIDLSIVGSLTSTWRSLGKNSLQPFR